VDPQGNAYVTGWISVGLDVENYATIKYDTNGNRLWGARYDGPLHGDRAEAVAVDSDGNVYVTGQSSGPSGSLDYATVKYDPDGNQLWVARYRGGDFPTAIAVDAAGNAYVTGCIWGGPETQYDYATVKYDPSGNEVWVARYDGPAHGEDRAQGIALDAQGNVYVTGRSCAEIGKFGCAHYDYATIKYTQK
jgi:streptogramin lyase